MHDGVQSFQLTIRLDQDGVQWTHFFGRMEHARAPSEIPPRLWAMLSPIIEALHQAGVVKFNFPSSDTQLPPQVPENAREILALMAWWMEWDRRIAVAHAAAWKCPNCEEDVNPKRGHCDNPACESWNNLHRVTGEPILELISGAKSA